MPAQTPPLFRTIIVSLALAVADPASAHATGFAPTLTTTDAPAGEAPAPAPVTTEAAPPQQSQPAAPAAPAPAAPAPAAPAPAAAPPVAAPPAPVAGPANVPIRPTRSAELAKVERGTSRALMISGIVFGVSSVAWGAAFVNASYRGEGAGSYVRDGGFVATGWTGGLALSITSATLLPIGLSRRANARIAEGLSPDSLESESRGLTTGIILTSAGGLMMITSPLLFSESSSLSPRQSNTVFAALFPASIVMIGAGSGLIAAANRIRTERRRQIIYSATPYFSRDMVGVGVSGRF